MKTQILQLEPHDDLISTRDKLGWRQTGRILLLWPRKGRILNRRLDLTLVQRHAASLGAQLALVTRDRAVRFHAAALGIPVFRTAGQAQNAPWRRVRRTPRTRRPVRALSLDDLRRLAHPPAWRWLEQPVPRLLVFLVGLLAVLALAAFTLPSAQVRLSPPVISQNLTLAVSADPDLESTNLSGIFPVTPLAVIVEGRQSLPASGSQRLPAEAARGQVQFTNLTTRAVDLPVGLTVVSLGENPVSFTVSEPGQVPAGPGSTLTLPVQAVLPGAAGNLPVGALRGVQGALGLLVTAENLAPTSGGVDRLALAVTEDDRQRLQTELLERLRRDAAAELADRARLNPLLAPGDVLLTPQPEFVRIAAASFNPAVNGPAPELTLELRAEFQALIVPAADFEAFAAAILAANLPPGYLALADSLTIEQLSLPQPTPAGGYTWDLRLTRLAQADPQEEELAALVRGLEPAQAARRLEETLALVQPAQISLFPEWLPRLPLLPFRIQVHLETTP